MTRRTWTLHGISEDEAIPVPGGVVKKPVNPQPEEPMSPTTEHAISLKRLQRMFPKHLADFLRDAGNGTLPQPYSPASFFLLADRIDALYPKPHQETAMSRNREDSNALEGAELHALEHAETTIRDLSRNRNRPMTNPTTEADSQTRTIRGVVDKVERGLTKLPPYEQVYFCDVNDQDGNQHLTLILDHPLTVGQTYEVEVTVREVE